MSHRCLSWILTLIAFLLFGLACTLSRKTEGSLDLSSRDTLSEMDGLFRQLEKADNPPPQLVARCGMEDFYRQNPSIKGQLTPIVEATVQIKLTDDLITRLKTSPKSLSQQLKACLGQDKRFAPASGASLADAEY